MSQKVVRVMKIQFPAGGAKPGPALAGAGIQMPKFCTSFNDQTRDRMGETVPVVLTVYEDKSFDFVLKTAPAAERIKKACNIVWWIFSTMQWEVRLMATTEWC